MATANEVSRPRFNFTLSTLLLWMMWFGVVLSLVWNVTWYFIIVLGPLTAICVQLLSQLVRGRFTGRERWYACVLVLFAGGVCLSIYLAYPPQMLFGPYYKRETQRAAQQIAAALANDSTFRRVQVQVVEFKTVPHVLISGQVATKDAEARLRSISDDYKESQSVLVMLNK